MPLDPTTLLTAAAALAAVIAIVLLAGRAARLTGLSRTPAGTARLALREVLALDGRRRLHRIACGTGEVLLLTGGPTDVVVGWVPPGGGSQP